MRLSPHTALHVYKLPGSNIPKVEPISNVQIVQGGLWERHISFGPSIPDRNVCIRPRNPWGGLVGFLVFDPVVWQELVEVSVFVRLYSFEYIGKPGQFVYAVLLAGGHKGIHGSGHFGCIPDKSGQAM